MDAIKLFSRNTFLSLNIRNYRLYFIGQGISLSGTWMQTIAQSWLVLQITHSGTMLGITTALQFLPILVLAPIGGVIADRFNKRHILYITQSIAGLLALILGILVFTNTIQLWMIFILATLLGIDNSFDNPARQTFVVEMVGEDMLQNAISLNSSEINVARVIGPVLAGILIAQVGIAICFILNAISYIAVLIVLYTMRTSELHVTEIAEKSKHEIIQGIEYIAHTPVLRNTLLMMAIIGTLSYEFTVSIPLLAQHTFHGDAQTFAILTAMMGLGSILGGIITASRRNGSPLVLTVAALLFGFSILATAISPNAATASIALIPVGIFSVIFLALGNTILQLTSEPQMRGRVMSLWAVAFLGTTPIGGPIIGWIGQHAGAQASLAVGGVAAIFAAAFGFSTLYSIKDVSYRMFTFLNGSRLASGKSTSRT